jgi:asparaginyl-tRNA synthetase
MLLSRAPIGIGRDRPIFDAEQVMATSVLQALGSQAASEDVQVRGWVRTRRDSKGFSFLEINDGSCLASLQVIIDQNCQGYADLKDVGSGASVIVRGRLVESPAAGQQWELAADEFEVVGLAGPDYPLQKKRHSLEFLREIGHLRSRTNLLGAVFRLRSRLSFAVHQFFQQRGFHYAHTPIITTSDCEGAGELFQLTTPGLESKEEFFGRPAFLTVSGQLEAETLACSMSKVYTFGPTFRADPSNTSRHVSEFWMIEPEMAFCDLNEDMDVAEEFIKSMVEFVLTDRAEDLAFFNKFVDQDLLARLRKVIEQDFKRISFTEAVGILEQSGRKFDHPLGLKIALQSEHERYLTEEHFKCPVTVFNYPKEIKPFYMRLNDDDQTVAAMDVLVPGIGEIVGGSQREERLDVLHQNMERCGLEPGSHEWYSDLRRYGTVPHAGFGLGFERLIMYLTGVSNIRDVIPFPRTPGHASF